MARAVIPMPPPDPSRGQPAAWVLDRYLYSDEIKSPQIRAQIGTPLLANYAKEHRIEPTKEQSSPAANHGWPRFRQTTPPPPKRRASRSPT